MKRKKNFMKLNERNIGGFQKTKGSGALPTILHRIDENDKTHQLTMEVKLLLDTSGYGAWRNLILVRREYSCHCLAQML